MKSVSTRCGLVACGLLLDRVTREPPSKWHLVAWFGTGMGHLETRLWADSRSRGAVYAGIGVATGIGFGRIAPWTMPATTLTAAGHELRSVAGRIGRQLDRGDLQGARAALPQLVGRDPSGLDEAGIASAVIESVAENTVDAVMAAAFWAAVAGAPGAYAYRAINTMDAMVGRRSDRYRRFGTVAARLDDVANLIPARLTAVLIAIQVPSRRHPIAIALRRDAPLHPSPNAGVVEATMAAAIDRQLGGPLRYGALAEDRPTLGSGARPTAADIARATTISNRAEWILVAVLATVWLIGLTGDR